MEEGEVVVAKGALKSENEPAFQRYCLVEGRCLQGVFLTE